MEKRKGNPKQKLKRHNRREECPTPAKTKTASIGHLKSSQFVEGVALALQLGSPGTLN
jgi:hypothetical protein